MGDLKASNGRSGCFVGKQTLGFWGEAFKDESTASDLALEDVKFSSGTKGYEPRTRAGAYCRYQ